MVLIGKKIKSGYISRSTWGLVGALKLRIGVGFDEGLKTIKGGVPLVRDSFEELFHVEDWLGVEGDQAFTARTGDVDHAGALEDVEMLGDGLAGEPGAFGELGDGTPLTAPQAGEHGQSCLIPQRGEDGSARGGRFVARAMSVGPGTLELRLP